MDRRSYLSIVAVTLAAGCTSDDTGTSSTLRNRREKRDLNPTQPPSTPTQQPPFTLSATDETPSSADISLTIRYNYTRTDTLPTDPPTAAEATQTWLVVRMAVKNRGSDPRELTTYQYVVEADNEVHEPVQTRADWSLLGERVGPGESATGWIPFQIPDYVTEASLRIRTGDRRSFAIGFEFDRGIDTNLPGQ